LEPGKSRKSIPERVTTSMVVIGGVAPVKSEESLVKVKVPFIMPMLPT
jgi:hypothetical protein